MPRDGTKTKTRILDAALQLSLEKGLAATAIDEVIEKSGITKGAFFYHFASKQDLAAQLIEHFARHDQKQFETFTERAENLSRDPLQQVLLLTGLLAEWFRDSGLQNPGCLFASFCYQGDLWTEDIRRICDDQLKVWSDWADKKLRKAARRNPPRIKTDIAEIARMANSVIEGAFVLARTTNDTDVIPRQLMAYRDYVELLFSPDLPAAKKKRARPAAK